MGDLPNVVNVARERQQRRGLYGLVGPDNPSPAPVTGTANYTYTVATLAARPAVNTLADGTLVYVQSQKSWYRSDLAGNTYRREPIADPTWMAQAAWGIDTVAGNDENIGSIALPLKTWSELRARLPMVSLNAYTITIAAGSAFTAADPMQWQPLQVQGASGNPFINVVGTRVLSTDKIVAASSNEAGNAAPLLDAGFAFTPGSIVQATSGAQNGATAVICELVAGTNFRTSRWRTAAGVATNAPAANDTVAVATMIAVDRLSFTAPNEFAIPTLSSFSNLSLTAIDLTQQGFNVALQTCVVAGSVNPNKPGFYSFDGCALLGNSFLGVSAGASGFLTLCGLVRVGGVVLDVTIGGGGFLQLLNTLIVGGGGLDISSFGRVLANHLGIFGTAARAIDVHLQGFLNISNTLYGTNNAGLGTRVREGGRVNVLTGQTPTLASVGQELELDGAANANPVAAGVPAAAAAMVSWANWAAAPFNRNVVSYSTGASIGNQT